MESSYLTYGQLGCDSFSSSLIVSMSSKSLSTGTLSLRFMQNAHRAKQLKEVELDRAEVKDDGMWEVSQAVRDAWGLKRDPDSSSVLSFPNRVGSIFFCCCCRSKDVHESSYLPFIFSAHDSVATDESVSLKKITGRRTFDNKGQEVSQSVKSSCNLVSNSELTTLVDLYRCAPSSKFDRCSNDFRRF